VQQPAPVRIELPTRDEAGADPAGHGSELAGADERAHVLLGAPELGGQLSYRQMGRLLDDGSMAARCEKAYRPITIRRHAGETIGCVSLAVVSVSQAAAARPPAFVVAAAKREAAALGDPRPTSAQYVLTRREAAVKASSGATVTSNPPVYLIVLTGRFETGPVGPAPGRIVTGTFATEVLDAATGSDTDFGVGSQPVSIRSLGLVGDLLPYLQGTATPVCSAPDLQATAEFQGATGSLLGGIAVRNRGPLACALPAAPAITLAWRGSRIPVRTSPFPRGWLARMNPRWGHRVSLLAPGARAQMILQWFDWCGRTPWGANRGFRLTVALRVPHQVAPIQTTTADLVAAPYCNARPGTPSTLRVSPFVSPS
jgi:hypothetical protein